MPRPLSLVLPAYDEGPAIAEVIREAHAALTARGAAFEIIVVDDGSRDATPLEVRALSGELRNVSLVRFEQNRGYGAALRAGFAAASMELVAYMDSDGQLDPRDLAPLAQLLEGADLAVGVRAQRSEGRLRWLLSRAYNEVAVRVLRASARDLNCGLKVFRRELATTVAPVTNGYLAGAEIIARAQAAQCRVRELPVRHRPRFVGRSKVTLRRSIHALLELLTLEPAPSASVPAVVKPPTRSVSVTSAT